MFNGIVYNQGTIKSLRRNPKYVRGSLVIEVASNIKFKKTDIGESVSCDGVCLTLIRIKKNSFLFYLSKETLNRSNFKNVKIDCLTCYKYVMMRHQKDDILSIMQLLWSSDARWHVVHTDSLLLIVTKPHN